MPGKIAEMLNSSTQVGFAARIGSATVYMNGRSATTSAIGIDMSQNDEAHIVLNVGTVLGPQATLMNALYVSETNDPSTASLLPGANFTVRKSTNGNAIEEGSVLAGACTGRYLFLRTELQGTPVTADFSAIINLRSKAGAVSKTLAFDLDV
jgi:hypothetical protein